MMYLIVLYILVKFQFPNYNTFRDMNYFLQLFSMTFGPVRTTDRQTESDAYEPTVQTAQVGSKTMYF